MEDKIFKYMNYLTLNFIRGKGSTKSSTLNILISGCFLPLMLSAIDVMVLMVWFLFLLAGLIALMITMIIKELLEQND